ncbi:type II secretion system F family protein [Vibrio breoganii]|uniref:Pilus assembly protein TadC n=2 Tax=Vibrio breoganii TaxID=553239 RepID=A0AAP8MWL0_9VIBR|nr:type II secretion system F family protein [Vibrio breoganii]NMO73308.1 type II secretion system F family protein [Vibrio breoganii]NMR69697.1 type II secretion system F family protein [Vibrio breoganii]PMG06038.1 pilus assembly protein TadC [Vibrio breoganii]PMG99821.1 pilus assembly protein TadC [Vibrio breoganii]PMH12763.1 pilus assembly protein TadC [Vibrio breoganii]
MNFNEMSLQFGVSQYLTRDNLFLAMVLVGTILAVLAIGIILLGFNSPLKRKLKSIGGNTDSSQSNGKINNTLENIAPIMVPNSKKERDSIQKSLIQAGYNDANALSLFYAIKLICALIGLFLAVSFYVFMQGSNYMSLMIIASLWIGLFGPNMFLARLVKERKEKIKAAVPDTLDLLVVCTESGLGFNAALKRVGDEVAISHPEFSDELETVCAKIQAGVEMPVAFKELVVRTGVEELTGLVSMLSHAAKVGGSIAQTLRDYTEDYRDKRSQAAEEVAAKIPTKMLFPMVLFIWPCFFIVALGPGLMTLFDALK